MKGRETVSHLLQFTLFVADSTSNGPRIIADENDKLVISVRDTRPEISECEIESFCICSSSGVTRHAANPEVTDEKACKFTFDAPQLGHHAYLINTRGDKTLVCGMISVTKGQEVTYGHEQPSPIPIIFSPIHEKNTMSTYDTPIPSRLLINGTPFPDTLIGGFDTDYPTIVFPEEDKFSLLMINTGKVVISLEIAGLDCSINWKHGVAELSKFDDESGTYLAIGPKSVLLLDCENTMDGIKTLHLGMPSQRELLRNAFSSVPSLSKKGSNAKVLDQWIDIVQESAAITPDLPRTYLDDTPMYTFITARVVDLDTEDTLENMQGILIGYTKHRNVPESQPEPQPTRIQPLTLPKERRLRQRRVIDSKPLFVLRPQLPFEGKKHYMKRVKGIIDSIRKKRKMGLCRYTGPVYYVFTNRLSMKK
jgi:hypothetical protein